MWRITFSAAARRRTTSSGGARTGVFLDALGADSLPDPTTAGDFCRRFDEAHIEALMDAINPTRLEVWQRCPGLVEETARVDGDGTLVPTTGACKEGMDIAYNGVWGLRPAAGVVGQHRRAALHQAPQRQPAIARGRHLLLRQGGCFVPARGVHGHPLAWRHRRRADDRL